MSDQNKATLEKANAAVTQGDHEGFLEHCTEDTTWEFVGEQVLKGKQAVRAYMAKTYIEPPQLTVDNLIAEGDHVVAVGKITLTNETGKAVNYAYSDVWEFRDGKMASLKAFVVEFKD